MFLDNDGADPLFQLAIDLRTHETPCKLMVVFELESVKVDWSDEWQEFDFGASTGES